MWQHQHYNNRTNTKQTHKASDWLHYGLVRCHSVVNKTQSIKIEINNLDLCALMETWVQLNDMLPAHKSCPTGYKAISIPRTGGGIALVHRADSNMKPDKNHTRSSMEGATFTYHCPSYTHHLTVVYRPPDASVVQFISNLTDILEEYVNCHGHHTILGDFNIWTNYEKDSDTIIFNDFLDTFDFTYKVQLSTNRQHNTIDFIIAPNKSNYIQNMKQVELFPDHHMIPFDIMESPSIWKFKTATYCKTKAMNKEEFSKNLAREFTS